jgi:putative colanic acid biosynthesis acetyltransferase WcaF
MARFHYPWKIQIGDNSWIGDDAYLYSLDYIRIGRNCVISQNTYINTGSHDIWDEAFGLITKPVVINDGVWIAANCFISLGIEIGENTVVGAMSNVQSSLPRDSICCGNPCRKLKDR